MKKRFALLIAALALLNLSACGSSTPEGHPVEPAQSQSETSAPVVTEAPEAVDEDEGYTTPNQETDTPPSSGTEPDDETEDNTPSVLIRDILRDFSEGYAWVETSFRETAIIDNKGNVCGVLSGKRYSSGDLTDFHNGHAMIAKQFICNTEGNIILDLNEYDGETIEFFGDAGTVLLHKQLSGIEGLTHVYTLIDLSGNEIGSFTNPPIKLQAIAYLGDDMYLAWNISEFKSYIVNFHSGQFTDLNGSYYYPSKFENGKARMKGAGGGGTVKAFTLDQETLEISEGGVIRSNNIDSDGRYFEEKNNRYYNPFDESYITITAYPDMKKKGYPFRDGYAVITIEGKDGNDYFSVIDETGELLFEPVKGEPLHYVTGEYVIAKIAAYDYWIFDLKGNPIHSITGDLHVRAIYDAGEGCVFIGSDYYYMYNVAEAAACGNEVYTIYGMPEETSVAENTPEPEKHTYSTVNRFSIEGTWKSVGSYGFGQAQPGAIIAFDDSHCNFFSPSDTYTLTQNGSDYLLECTSYMSTDTLQFTVKTIDKDHIDIFYGDAITELQRVE